MGRGTGVPMVRTIREWRVKMNHKWERKGGCSENPGVWGIGGAAIAIVETCSRCGARREKIIGDVDRPSRNHGWRLEGGGIVPHCHGGTLCPK